MAEYLYSKKPKFLKTLKKILLFIAESVLVVLAAWLIIHFAVEKNIIVGDSMAPTLEDESVILINKLAYVRKAPERNDVVVFNQGKGDRTYLNVKRVIGLPGDKLEILNGKVFINDELFQEEIKVEDMRLAGLAASGIYLQDNEYFVLGDNRNSSEDSRFANVGLVVRDDIYGKAIVVIKPQIAFIRDLNLKEKE